MRVWRICRAPFADLTGAGARLYGGRWNSEGAPVVYTSESVALAALELRVHLDLPPELVPADYVLMEIDVPETGIERLDVSPDDPKAAGDEWLSSKRSLALKVRSFVVPLSWNVLINPEHPEVRSVTANVRPFLIDMRLWLPLKG